MSITVDRFTYAGNLYHVTTSVYGGYRVVDVAAGVTVTDGHPDSEAARTAALSEFRAFDVAMGGAL